MNNLFLYIVTGCISFTFSTIFYLLFSFLSIFLPLDEQVLLNLLAISFCINCLIYVKSLLPIYHPVFLRLLEIFIIVFVLLVVTAIFNMSRSYALMVILTGLMTYVVVMIVGYSADLFSAKKINLAIQNKKKGFPDEKNH